MQNNYLSFSTHQNQFLQTKVIFILMIFIGGLTFGYNISIIASSLPKIKIEFNLSDGVISLIAGLVFAGMALAKLTMSLFNDRLGRRKTLLIATFMFIISTLIIVVAKSGTYVIVGRTLQGFWSGLLMFTTSLYIVELADDKNRGKYTALYQLSFTIGLLLANVMGMYFYYVAWKYNFIFLVVCNALFMLVMFFLPCSPRFLLAKGYIDKCKNALLITHNRDVIDNIINSWQSTNINNTNVNVFQKQYLKALILVVIVTCLNQLTGINAILQTSTVLISSAGLQNHAALIGSIGITAVNVVGTLIGINIVDRYPRNKVLGFCGVAICLAHLLVSINFFSGLHSGYILIIGLLLFILSFAVGPGIIIWLVFSEYLPMPVRSQGIAVAGFINAIVGFFISSTFLYIGNKFGLQFVFLACSICSLIYGLISIFYLPNTTGKDIEDFTTVFEKEQ